MSKKQCCCVLDHLTTYSFFTQRQRYKRRNHRVVSSTVQVTDAICTRWQVIGPTSMTAFYISIHRSSRFARTRSTVRHPLTSVPRLLYTMFTQSCTHIDAYTRTRMHAMNAKLLHPYCLLVLLCCCHSISNLASVFLYLNQDAWTSSASSRW